MRKLIIGVDLGGSKILSGIADNQGRILINFYQPTQPQKKIAETLDSIKDTVDMLQKDVGARPDEIMGIAVGTPGPVSYPQGIICRTPNLHWENVDMKKELSSRLGRNVIIDNDGNMAALGEYYFGWNRLYRNLLYMTIGTGIGGGIVINGRIYHGTNGGAGEFGHMVIEPDGPVCGCGRRGCLEALAAGTAVAHEARQLIKQGQGQALREAGRNGSEITAREVGICARQGDPEALDIISRLTKRLGSGIANLVNLFNPDLVVLGGGMGVGLKDLLLEPVTAYVKSQVFPMHSKNLQIKVSDLGEEAGLMGCMAAVLMDHEQ